MHESGQDDYAACPDDEWLSPDPLDHLFKVAYVRGPDVQQSVGFARDGAGSHAASGDSVPHGSQLRLIRY